MIKVKKPRATASKMVVLKTAASLCATVTLVELWEPIRMRVEVSLTYPHVATNRPRIAAQRLGQILLDRSRPFDQHLGKYAPVV